MLYGNIKTIDIKKIYICRSYNIENLNYYKNRLVNYPNAILLDYQGNKYEKDEDSSDYGSHSDEDMFRDFFVDISKQSNDSLDYDDVQDMSDNDMEDIMDYNIPDYKFNNKSKYSIYNF